MVYRINTKAKLKAGILLFDYKDIFRKFNENFSKKRKGRHRFNLSFFIFY